MTVSVMSSMFAYYIVLWRQTMTSQLYNWHHLLKFNRIAETDTSLFNPLEACVASLKWNSWRNVFAVYYMHGDVCSSLRLLSDDGTLKIQLSYRTNNKPLTILLQQVNVILHWCESRWMVSQVHTLNEKWYFPLSWQEIVIGLLDALKHKRPRTSTFEIPGNSYTY